jgi:hypothetical protein
VHENERRVASDAARGDYPAHRLSRMSGGPQPPVDGSRDLEAIPNRTGLPDRLKAGIESLSGLAMDDVRVHFNSAEPATLQAHAYARGGEIHLGPGQEQHLPHEAWHVAQQKQRRVKPTLQRKGNAINDDGTLEREADVMGARARSHQAPPRAPAASGNRPMAFAHTVGRIFQLTDDDAKAYIEKQGIEDKRLDDDVNFENVKHYCYSQHNDQAKRIGLAKAWNKGRAKGFANFIDIPAIKNEKPAPATAAASAELPAAAADAGKQNVPASQDAAPVNIGVPAAGHQPVANSINAAPPANKPASTVKPVAAAVPVKAAAAPQVKAAPATRKQQLEAEGKRLVTEVDKHYAANGNRGSPSHRYVDSVIKTTFKERQQIRSYLWRTCHDKDAKGLKDVKYYIVGGPTEDKIDITGHRHVNGKDKSKQSHTNVFNYHVNWTT